ncbi:MAG: phage tail domain-containing protein [Bacilli bacterium]
MSFASKYFQFDSVKSSDMELYIVKIDSGFFSTEVSGGQSFISDKIPYKDVAFRYGTELQTLRFSITCSPLDKYWTDDFKFNIFNWLNGREPKEFKTSDFMGKLCYCICTNTLEIYTAGNDQGYITLEFESITPYWLSNRQIIIKDLTDLTVPYTFDINCKSNVQHPKYGNIYIPEKVEIQLIGTSTSFTLTNLSDMGRVTQFTELSAGETITMYPNTLRLESSTGLNRLSNFNKNWFRLTLGKNILKINEKCIIAITTMYPLYM